MIQWIFGQTNDNVTGQYNFIVQYQPKIPQTSSNLTIVCYRNKTKKSILPAKIKWFKLKNQTITQIIGIKGSTYPCQPSDLGCKIKAQIISLDQQLTGTAQIWFGPIRIDMSIKQTLTNIIYSGHTLFPIYTIKDKQKQATLKINKDEISIIDTKSQKSFKFQFSLSQPRLQLNPKDITKLYLRFRQQNTQQLLKNYMNSVYQIDSQKSSKSTSSRLFKNDNKLQIKFISRNSRDLFILTIKAFCAKKQMKNSLVIQKIQRIDLNNDQIFNKFFQFQSLKNDIVRINLINKQLILDRDQKAGDLKLMQQQISTITMTYLKIIQQKCKDQLQLNQSYSQLSLKRDQLVTKNKTQKLQKQNAALQQKIRQLTQKVEAFQFFKKGNDTIMMNNSRMFNNESMIFPSDKQTMNPFEKKSNRVYEQMPSSSKNIIQLNKMNLKLLEQNKQLKQQHQRLQKQRSKNQIFNILDSLNNEDQQENILKHKYKQLQKRYNDLEKKNTLIQKKMFQLEVKIKEYQKINTDLQKQLNQIKKLAFNHSITVQNKTVVNSLNQSNILSNSIYDHSVSSQVQIKLLQLKFTQIKTINEKLLVNNEQMCKKMNKYKKQSQYLLKELNILREKSNGVERRQQKVGNKKSSLVQIKQQTINNSYIQNNEVNKIKEQNQILKLQKNTLLKKYQTLVSQSQKLKNYFQLQFKFQQLLKTHKNCPNIINTLQQQINKFKNQGLQQSRVQLNQSERLKQINSNLHNQLLNLKKQIQILKQNSQFQTVQTLNRKIFQLQNQLDFSKNQSSSNINQVLSDQLFQVKKNLQKIKSQSEDKDRKIKSLNQNLQRLMSQIMQKSQRSYYSQLNTSGSGSIQKYKKKIKQLQNQIILLRKNTLALNRSRDLSMDMESFNGQLMDSLKKEIDTLLKQNERIGQMSQKYLKQAKEMNKVRQQNIALKKKIEMLQRQLQNGASSNQL